MRHLFRRICNRDSGYQFCERVPRARTLALILILVEDRNAHPPAATRGNCKGDFSVNRRVIVLLRHAAGHYAVPPWEDVTGTKCRRESSVPVAGNPAVLTLSVTYLALTVLHPPLRSPRGPIAIPPLRHHRGAALKLRILGIPYPRAPHVRIDDKLPHLIARYPHAYIGENGVETLQL